MIGRQEVLMARTSPKPASDAADPSPTIVGLQRELAQARAERDESLARETAIAEVLDVIHSSPGDLALVFDAILEKALHLCQAAFGALWTYDGEYMHAVATGRYTEGRWQATRNVPSPMVEFLRQGPHPPASVVQRALVDGAPYDQIADLRLTDGYRAGEPIPRAGADLAGVRTLLGVALRKHDKLLGVIGVYRQEVRPFTEKEISLLQNFAAQAVIAMENARLITETREALEQQTATAEVLGVINSSPGDLRPVFDTILEKAHTLCGAALGSLRIYDGEYMRAVAVRGHSEPAADALRWGLRVSDLRLTKPLLDGAPFVHARDLTHFDDPLLPAGSRWAGTSLAVPLRKDDALLGMIVAAREEVQPFSDKQIALLQNFAAQAVVAMENARLITETREALGQQTATAEVLGVINSSPGDLTPVFEAMLDKATSLCGAAFGTLFTYNEVSFRAVALHEVPAAFAATLDQPFRPSSGAALDRLLRGERFVHLADVSVEDAYRAGQDAHGQIQLGGARSLLAVPLHKEDEFLGAFVVYRQEVRPFTEKQIALVTTFADQAVIAMENARLLGELRARTDEIAGWNRELEARVAAQLAEIERTGRLRRFLAPQLADMIVTQGDESILESHRREIVVVFCDLRGFTAFAERAEPEEVMALLREYHAAMGPIVAQYEGTIDHYGGDGIMVFFNDPVPTPDPARRAIDMAVAMRETAQPLLRTWRRHGHDLGFGVGIAQGYATLGQIGFAERMDYTAIGTVTNLAARLCAEAKDAQILVSSRVATAIEDTAGLEEIGDLALKGLSQAVAVYNVP
jgi:class 3 adenylate cyclase